MASPPSPPSSDARAPPTIDALLTQQSTRFAVVPPSRNTDEGAAGHDSAAGSAPAPAEAGPPPTIDALLAHQSTFYAVPPNRAVPTSESRQCTMAPAAAPGGGSASVPAPRTIDALLTSQSTRGLAILPNAAAPSEAPSCSSDGHGSSQQIDASSSGATCAATTATDADSAAVAAAALDVTGILHVEDNGTDHAEGHVPLAPQLATARTSSQLLVQARLSSPELATARTRAVLRKGEQL